MKKEANKKSPAKPLRCLCGRLLARIVPEGVELKCRRCKRQLVLPMAELIWDEGKNGE